MPNHKAYHTDGSSSNHILHNHTSKLSKNRKRHYIIYISYMPGPTIHHTRAAASSPTQHPHLPTNHNASNPQSWIPFPHTQLTLSLYHWTPCQMQFALANLPTPSMVGIPFNYLLQPTQPLDTVPSCHTPCDGQPHPATSSQSFMNHAQPHLTYAASYPPLTPVTNLSPAPNDPSIEIHELQDPWYLIAIHPSLQPSIMQFYTEITKALENHQNSIQCMFNQLFHHLHQTLSSTYQGGTVTPRVPISLELPHSVSFWRFQHGGHRSTMVQISSYSLLPFLLSSTQL